jgi:hypothetical protein
VYLILEVTKMQTAQPSEGESFWLFLGVPIR